MAASFTAAKSEFDTQMGGERSGFKLVAGTLSLGDDYTNGGEPVAASTFDSDASTLHTVILSAASQDGTLVASYDGSGVLAFAIGDGTETSDATDLSAAAKSFECIAVLS